MRRIVFALIAVIVAGCTYPNSSVRTVDSRPSLAIANASKTARLLIDGADAGLASSFDGKKQKLQLERGTHKVVILDQGRIVFETTVYLGDEITKTITVPSP